ncbi:MAG: hypothetical protein ABWZ25_15085 [Chitinophagaceae bacterium]
MGEPEEVTVVSPLDLNLAGPVDVFFDVGRFAADRFDLIDVEGLTTDRSFADDDFLTVEVLDDFFNGNFFAAFWALVIFDVAMAVRLVIYIGGG